MRTIRLLAALPLMPASLGFASHAALAAPALDALFSDHAVLQRGMVLPITGQADPGESVTVSIGSESATATADKSGHFRAMLPALQAGGPYLLSARSARGESAAKDILIGDVWLCSGQSNMEFTVSQGLNGFNEAANANDPQLRMIRIPKSTGATPKSEFGDKIGWESAQPEAAPGFSAACYYMAKDLRAKLGIPIGAINASWGGTQIRAWLDPDGVQSIYAGGAARLLDLYATDPSAAMAEFAPTWESWWREQSGDRSGTEPWAAPDRLDWKPVPAIDYWERWGVPDLANYNNMVWLRRSVVLDKAQAGQDLTLNLGIIDELDQTWVNGHPVGNTFSWDLERHYRVPSDYLREGRNEIVVAAVDSWGNGGMKGPADLLSLTFGDGSVLPIGEGWTYRRTPVTAPPRAPWDNTAGLGVIYNGMIAPIGTFPITGVAWYQGESDVGIAGYRDRLAALFKGWRNQFRRSDLPFLIVSLANYGPYAIKPSGSSWADLREEQRQATLADSHAALAITFDIGDRTDIHPGNKQLVGARLSRAAGALAYGERHAPSGPTIDSATRDGENVVLTFGGVEGALHSWSGRTALAFELCGATQASCRYADATPSGNQVRLLGDGKPITRIRYGWADSPIVNLYDEAELPPGPFEIDVTP